MSGKNEFHTSQITSGSFAKFQGNLFLFVPVQLSALATLMLRHFFTALFFNGAHILVLND